MISEKARIRNEKIDALVQKAQAENDCTDRMYWTLIHDFEHAPLTTNLEQIKDAGLEWTTVDQLAVCLGKIGVYLIHTDHLSDSELKDRLVNGILIEPVRDLPPDSGVHEFIDLIGGGGPVERDIYQKYYASAEERKQFVEQYGYRIEPMVKPNNRDATLPKPNKDQSTQEARIIAVEDILEGEEE